MAVRVILFPGLVAIIVRVVQWRAAVREHAAQVACPATDQIIDINGANAWQVNSLLPHIIEMQRQCSRLSMPIELIHGRADTIVPAHVRAQIFANNATDHVARCGPYAAPQRPRRGC